MSWSRRLSIPLLIGATVLPPAATSAQNDLIDAWAASGDGRVFATNGDPDELPVLRKLGPDEFPELVADLPGPDTLYHLDEVPPDGSTRVIGLHDANDLAWVGEGRTPLLAKVVIDGDEPHWIGNQHIISTPAGCSAATGPNNCIVPWVLGAPGTEPMYPPPVPDDPRPGFFASTGATSMPGTLFSFAGDSTVGTTVKVRQDGKIVVRGAVEIGEGLGGRLRGYDAQVVEIHPDGSLVDPVTDMGWGDILAVLRSTNATQNKPNRRVLECPGNGQGYIHSRFLVNGLGRNLASFGGDTLDGGAKVVVSEIIPFECPAANGNSLLTDPGAGPAASLWCISMWPNHSEFMTREDAVRTIYFSSLLEALGIITVGIPIDADFTVTSRVGGANGGTPFAVSLEGIQLESATHPDAVLWVGQAEVGINSTGSKKLRRLDISGDFGTIDLLDQRHAVLGESIEITASEEPVGNCPKRGWPTKIAPPIFADGFDPGDFSTWSGAQ